MSEVGDQMAAWLGVFGKEYTDRNALSLEDMEALYHSNYGVSRTELNERFVNDLDRSIRILEVGSNVGNQLACLQKMGFRNLYGIELQSYAVEIAKSRTSQINIIEGSAFDIPFKDGFFDLVFTSGVLIHISPDDVVRAVREVYRCARKYIWGFEYYADTYTEVAYRGHRELLWKTNFVDLYRNNFPALRLLKEERVQYINAPNVDSMFLLVKEE